MPDSPIQQLIPSAGDLLNTPVQRLAPILLKQAYEKRMQVGFLAHTERAFAANGGYPFSKKTEVDAHLSRAWRWLERKGYIEPSPGMNGQHGWKMLTDEGQAILNGSTIEEIQAAQEFPKALLHQAIFARCEKLFWSGHYAEAVELSFKVVRDRLRELTNYETGSEAFGKGKLRVKGAIASHVDEDFNEGVKFLTMAIDKFRNEKAHTSKVGIDSPTKAFQYLVLSSLAMRLLDNAEQRREL
jgi:uncharacterized protein (TIGR02391 family)